MKIRTSFVSNSSSSSYLLVGVATGTKSFNQLAKALELPLDTKGQSFWDWCSGEDKEHHSYCEYGIRGSSIRVLGGLEPYAIGIEAESKFVEQDLKLSQIKKLFIQCAKREYKVDINPRDVELFSGEMSSE